MDNVTYATSTVPEPTTLALLGTDLLGLAMMRRRKLSRTGSHRASRLQVFLHKLHRQRGVS